MLQVATMYSFLFVLKWRDEVKALLAHDWHTPNSELWWWGCNFSLQLKRCSFFNFLKIAECVSNNQEYCSKNWSLTITDKTLLRQYRSCILNSYLQHSFQCLSQRSRFSQYATVSDMTSTQVWSVGQFKWGQFLKLALSM